jgi:hypothetical protein
MPAYKENKINTLHEFIVEGTFDFPIDMLRFDRCWPKHESDDSASIAGSLSRIGRNFNKRAIKLVGLNEPTVGRWSSFGWTVTDHQVRRLG